MDEQKNDTRAAAFSGILAGALIIALTAMALSNMPFSNQHARFELIGDAQGQQSVQRVDSK
jgi:hypothetical protein